MPTLAQIDVPQIAFLAGVLLLVFFSLTSVRRRLRRRGPSPAQYAREQISRLHEETGLKQDMQQLIAELHEAAQRLNAQLDTKAAKLEALISDADERLARLDGRPVATEIDVTVGAEAPAPDATSAADATGPISTGDAGGAVPDAPGNPSFRPADRGTHRDKDRVYALADKGKNPVEIAQTTGLKPGEVELILAIRETT
jgi:hypothetical protein